MGAAGDWGKIPNGGKDGLYLVMVSLGWWINAHDPLKESMLDDAIADVTFVVDSLVSFLAREANGDDEPGSKSEPEPEPSLNTPSPAPPKKRRQSVKIGPPRNTLFPYTTLFRSSSASSSPPFVGSLSFSGTHSKIVQVHIAHKLILSFTCLVQEKCSISAGEGS